MESFKMSVRSLEGQQFGLWARLREGIRSGALGLLCRPIWYTILLSLRAVPVDRIWSIVFLLYRRITHIEGRNIFLLNSA